MDADGKGEGTDVKMTLTDWMRGCSTCVELADALNQAWSNEDYALKELNQMQNHLVSAHSGRIPDYVEDCPNCQEWKHTLAHPEQARPGFLPILQHEGRIHRAGHLILSGAAPQRAG